MGKLCVLQTKCPQCKHTWCLITDDSLGFWTYYTWLVTTLKEHIEIRKRIKHED